MEPYFIARGKLEAEVLNELKKYVFSPGFELSMRLCMIFSAAIALLFLVMGFFSLSSIFFVGGILIYLERMLGRKHYITKILAPIKKAGQNSLEFDMHFYDDFFTVEGMEDRQLTIYYVHIVRVVQTVQCYICFTKGNLCFPVLRDSIESGKEQEWLNFILTRHGKTRLQKE